MTEFTFTPHGSKYDKDKPYEQHKDESVPVQLKDGSYALMDFVLHYQTCFVRETFVRTSWTKSGRLLILFHSPAHEW